MILQMFILIVLVVGLITLFLSDAETRRILREILAVLSPPPQPQIRSVKLSIEGATMGAPVTIQMGQTATASLAGFGGPNGTGPSVPLVGPVSFASGNAAIATVDSTSGLITPIEPGTVTITGTDAASGMSDTVVVTINAAPPPTLQSVVLTVTPN